MNSKNKITSTEIKYVLYNESTRKFACQFEGAFYTECPLETATVFNSKIRAQEWLDNLPKIKEFCIKEIQLTKILDLTKWNLHFMTQIEIWKRCKHYIVEIITN